MGRKMYYSDFRNRNINYSFIHSSSTYNIHWSLLGIGEVRRKRRKLIPTLRKLYSSLEAKRYTKEFVIAKKLNIQKYLYGN